MKHIVDEISYGLGLDHPHVIKVPPPPQQLRCAVFFAGGVAAGQEAAGGRRQQLAGRAAAARSLPAPPCRAPSAPALQCFQCWEDAEQGCINMITEFFTSGALR